MLINCVIRVDNFRRTSNLMLFIAQSHATHNCPKTFLKKMENLTYNTKQTSNWMFLLPDTCGAAEPCKAWF